MPARKTTTNSKKAEMVVIIFNQGHEQLISDIARELEISGGTFLDAQGMSKFEAEKFFNIVISPEKSICMIVINSARRNEVFKKFYERIGMGTEAQGIIFSLPIEGLSENLTQQLFKDKTEKKEEK